MHKLCPPPPPAMLPRACLWRRCLGKGQCPVCCHVRALRCRYPNEEVVVLSQVLACDATLGYEDIYNVQVCAHKRACISAQGGRHRAVIRMRASEGVRVSEGVHASEGVRVSEGLHASEGVRVSEGVHASEGVQVRGCAPCAHTPALASPFGFVQVHSPAHTCTHAQACTRTHTHTHTQSVWA